MASSQSSNPTPGGTLQPNPCKSKSTTKKEEKRQPTSVRLAKLSREQADSDINILVEDSDANGYDLVDDMTRFRDHPLKYLDTMRKHYSGDGWRAYNDYVGAKLYYPEWFEHMLQETINRPVLRDGIAELVQRRMDMEQSWTWTAAEREARRAQYTEWLNSMVRDIAVENMPRFKNKNVPKFMYYVLAQVFSRCYHQGVHVSENDVRRVREKARELEKKKQSLLLFPCHKSHVDYISLVFVCFRIGLSLPVTIAGDNLNMAVMGSLLKEVGACYIRRTNWNQDPLYTAFFQALVDAILRNGLTLQCFVEGTRSRTGKLLPPKFGILKFVLEAILSGSVPDAWVLPISTQYDKVFEGDTYATELLGKEKRKESFMSFLESSSIVSLKLGRVDIRFGEIWSLRNYIIGQLQLEHTTTFPLPRPILDNERIYLLRSLGYRILADINQTSAVMPSALVGAVLLTTTERGTSRQQLITRVTWLIRRVVEAGGHIGAIPKNVNALEYADIAGMVDNAISVLGPDLVETESKKLLEPVYYPKDEFKLSYYRNQTVFLFVSEAITCIALYTLSKRDYTSMVRFDELERKVKFLSVLLSGEFVYKPDGLETNLKETLKTLARQNVISVSDDGETVSLNIDTIQNGIPVFDFYCYLIWPFIDGYWSVTLSLFSLPPGGSIKDRDFFKMAQTIARTLYAQGELTHSESLNQEMIKFATQHFESQGVVQRETSEETGITTLTLTPEFSPRFDQTGHVVFEGPLYDMSEEIALSRNKHLRYGITQTITDRMLSLCQPVALSLCQPKV